MSQVPAGATVLCRGGIYWCYGQVYLGAGHAGTLANPITIRSMQNELAIFDFGWQAFWDSPDTAWEPVPAADGGVEGEFRSTAVYSSPIDKLSGNFGDSTIPLSHYLFLEDMRSRNEYFLPGMENRQPHPTGIYWGPGGLWNAADRRFHIRLAHTHIPQLDTNDYLGTGASNNYNGTQDPRQISLSIARYGDHARFRFSASHLRIQDIVIRGGTAPQPEGAVSNVWFDGVWFYWGHIAALDFAGTDCKLLNCKIRGFGAPWHSRFHHKDRSRSGATAILGGQNLEIDKCEFTDGHDGIVMHTASTLAGLKFRRSLVENFNDDGIFLPTKRTTGVYEIYQLKMRQLLSFFAWDEDGSGVIEGADQGLYTHHNLYDLRPRTYGSPPPASDPGAEILRYSLVNNEHGEPAIRPGWRDYHNALIVPRAAISQSETYGIELSRDYRDTIRDLRNNIIVVLDTSPYQTIADEAGGTFNRASNLHWGPNHGQSGPHSGDVYANPLFTTWNNDWRQPLDLHLLAASPARGTGTRLPVAWPNNIAQCGSAPDIGPIPFRVTDPVIGPLSNLEEAGQHLIDRTATTGARTAAGPPCALVLAVPGIENIAYRDTAGHMNEIWCDPQGQGTTDLTANAGAPAAIGNPFTYFDPAGNQVVLIFRGNDQQVRSLYWMFGAVGHDNLTGSINAPKTVSDPAGWFSTHDGFHHVVYRTADGHLHELWWQGQGGVGHGDLTAQANAVSAAGDPWPYYDSVRSTNIVAFRGADRHIRSLFWGPDGAVGQDDLSGFAGTPRAASAPFAWFTPPEDTHRIVYRAVNGHLYELFWPDVAPVQGRDLTALSGAPPAVGNVSGGYNPCDNTQHVIFRARDGRLHELWSFLGETAVHHVDLTAAYGAPSAADRPVYYASPWAPNQHVAYRGTNGHIYELLW